MQQIRVASPCSADWEKMAGDERVRFCSACQLNVYNFSAMTAAEIDQLLRTRNERLCGRFYTRPDGTMLTQDCPVGFRARVHKASRWAGAALTALIGVGWAAAQDEPRELHNSSIAEAPADQPQAIITVADESGAVIPNATVVILDSQGSQKKVGLTDDRGTYRASLAPGKYTATINSRGFDAIREPFQISPLTTIKVHITLRLAQMGIILSMDGATLIDPESSAVRDFLPVPPDPQEPNPIAPTPTPTKSRFTRLIQKLGF